MREIVSKYNGECRKCGTTIPAGSACVYERRVGVFCPGCAPTDPEEIRSYRQEAADRKADRLEEWAEKRREKAAAIHAQNEPYRSDVAFNTQPGHIPLRARVLRRTEKAWEHEATVQRFEAKADSLRHVQVAGDAAKRHDEDREFNRSRIAVGDAVDCIFGAVRILKINRKTCKVQLDNGGTVNVDIGHLFVFGSKER